MTRPPLSSAAIVCLLASGSFLLCGLLAGVWKYRGILKSSRHRAPVYVDIAHRAALLYSFACIVMMELVQHSPYSTTVQLFATTVPIFFFAAAVGSYVWHGILDDTENQFERKTFVTTWGMVLLIIGELGGVIVLLWGFVVTEVL